MATQAQNDWVGRVLEYAFPADGAAAAVNGRLLPVWQGAKDAADAQLSTLYDVLHETGIPVLAEVAGQIESVLEGYRVGLIATLMAYDGSAGAAKEKARAAALRTVGDYAARLASDPHVTAADTNPFGVAVSVRAPLAAALATLERQLGSK